MGSSVPAASQPSRRALQRQKVQTCGARQELGESRAQRAGVGVRGAPAAWPRRRGVPWTRGLGGYLAAPAGHLPAQFPRGAATEASARGGEPSPWCPIQTVPVPARGGEEGARRPTSGRSGSQRGGCRCFCRVSGPQRRDRAERAFVEPGGEADSCPVSSVTRPPPCAGKCVRGRGIPRQAEPGPKLSPVARRG